MQFMEANQIAFILEHRWKFICTTKTTKQAFKTGIIKILLHLCVSKWKAIIKTLTKNRIE